MGEKQDEPLQLSFNASMKPDSQGPRITPDGGRFLVRKLDKHWGLTALTAENVKGSPHHV
jgi:hypothetical protein